MAAIYQPKRWENYWLTTTPYPVDVAEGLVIGCSPAGGTLTLVPFDNVETTFAVQGMNYTQTRWFYTDGPYDDEVETTFSVEEMLYYQTRWFYTDGPYDDEVETTFAVIDFSYIGKLVEADTPDESIQMSIAIMNTCSMDAV